MLLFIAIIFSAIQLLASPAYAAIKIAVSAVSDLNFGPGVAGDSTKTIPPGTSENAQNASFLVTGDPNFAFTITLPTSMTMTAASGGSGTKKIDVAQFVSFPAEGANGLLDITGKKYVFVGATRSALAANQVAGAYSGTLRITVVY